MPDEGAFVRVHRPLCVEELTLSNSLQLTALVELLEERGILTQAQVIERVKTIRDK